jgi:hypothetical protein
VVFKVPVALADADKDVAIKAINQVAGVVDIKDFNHTTSIKCKDSNNHSTNSNTVDNNNSVDTKVVDKDVDTKDVAKAVAVEVYVHSTATVGLMAPVLIQVPTAVLLPTLGTSLIRFGAQNP